jgi:hypothetical protein
MPALHDVHYPADVYEHTGQSGDAGCAAWHGVDPVEGWRCSSSAEEINIRTGEIGAGPSAENVAKRARS